MWKLPNPRLEDVVYDRKDAGLGVEDDQALYFEDELFANAVSETSWGEDQFQVVVCSDCGVEGCEQGGWYRLVQAGAYAAFIPLFDNMLVKEHEYSPPRHKAGTPVLRKAEYEPLREELPSLRPWDELPRLSGSEAMRLWQWETPYRLLGNFTDAVCLREDLVAASELSDLASTVGKVTEVLSQADRVELIAARSAEPSLWLDMRGTPALSIVGELDGEHLVQVGEFLLRPTR